MKKYIFIIAVIFTNLISCKEKPESLCPCGKVEINKKEYISMCIIPDIVSENSVNKLIIENHTKKEVVYGIYFSLEYFDENGWTPIPLNIISTYIGIILHAGKINEEKLDLYNLVKELGDLKKGKYRIIKKIESHSLYAEFEVKNNINSLNDLVQ